MIRMLIIGYCFGIRSERRLCDEVHLDLAYRWFCRLGLEGDVPDVKPLRYEPDNPPSKSYLLLPDAMLSDPDSLRSWMARSAAGLKPTSKKPRKKPLEGKQCLVSALLSYPLPTCLQPAPSMPMRSTLPLPTSVQATPAR